MARRTETRNKREYPKKRFFSQFVDGNPTEPNRHSSGDPDPAADQLIIALSDSKENRRARQVFEWESARRNSGIQIA